MKLKRMVKCYSLLLLSIPLVGIHPIHAISTAVTTKIYNAVANGNNRGLCTGVLIAPNMVLTSAHCTEIEKVSFFRSSGRRSIYLVERSEIYPGYFEDPINQNMAHDLRILYLEENVRGIEPMELYAGNIYDHVGEEVELIGFGSHYNEVGDYFDFDNKKHYGTNFIGDLDDLPYTDLDLNVGVNGVDAQDIIDHLNYDPYFDYGVLFFGQKQPNGLEIHTCYGDSGGPAIYNGKVVAVTTHGDTDNGECASRWSFSTRVDGGSHENYNWIQCKINGSTPPQILTEPETMLTLGEVFEYTMFADDVDRESVSYAIRYLFNNDKGTDMTASVSLTTESYGPNRIARIAWQPSQAGEYRVKLVAKDPNGCFDVQMFTINVLPAPQIRISSDPEVILTEAVDGYYHHEISVQVNDDDINSARLNYSIEAFSDNVPLSNFISINGSTISIKKTNSYNRVYFFKIKVEDPVSGEVAFQECAFTPADDIATNIVLNNTKLRTFEAILARSGLFELLNHLEYSIFVPTNSALGEHKDWGGKTYEDYRKFALDQIYFGKIPLVELRKNGQTNLLLNGASASLSLEYTSRYRLDGELVLATKNSKNGQLFMLETARNLE